MVERRWWSLAWSWSTLRRGRSVANWTSVLQSDWTSSRGRRRRGIFLCSLEDFIATTNWQSGVEHWALKWNNVLQEIEGSTENNPFDAIFVTLTEGLPDGLFFGSLSSDTYPCATAGAIRAGGILLDLAKFDTLWWDVMASISKVEHGPEGSIGIGLGNLEERKIRRIRRRKGELVDGRNNPGIGYGPLEVTRGLTPDHPGRRG